MDFFKSVPGLLITLGIVLLVVALIILLVQSRKVKKANKKAAAAGGEQPVPGANAVQPSVQPAGMAPIADPTQPVQQQVDPNMGVAQETQLPGVVAADANGVQPIAIDPNEVNEATTSGFSSEVKVLPIDGTPVDASTGDVTTPSFEVPQQPAPVAAPAPAEVQPAVPAPTPVEAQPVIEPAPAVSVAQPEPIAPAPAEVQPAPIAPAPAAAQPVELQEVAPEAPQIYGGASPAAPTVEAAQVAAPQIYGGADPLENTQPIPQVPSISSVPTVPAPAPASDASAEVKVPEIQSVGQ